MPDLPGRLTPITEALGQVFGELNTPGAIVSTGRIALLMDAVIVKSIAAELRALAPTLCRGCKRRDYGEVTEVPETGVFVHRERYGPHDWDDTVCEASPLYERAREVELAAGLPVGRA